MTRLRSGDLQSILEAVREVGRAPDPDAFTRSVVQQVARLVLSDFVAVNEVDPDLGRVVYMTEPSSFTVAPEFEALLIELADVTQERAPRTEEEEEEEEVLLASPPGGHSEDGTRGLWMKGQTVRMDLESARPMSSTQSPLASSPWLETQRRLKPAKRVSLISPPH